MVSTVGERDIGLLEIEDGDRWNMEMGRERTRLKAEGTISGECGVEGQPWSWAQQSSQMRELTMGELGDSNSDKGTLRGGWRKARLEVSSIGVEREEHGAQKRPPHLRQC